MGNALAHRDYELTDPTRVTVFEDRIEILSPGSLPFGIDVEKFRLGEASPRWRNQALAWFFNRLQIAQAEGQGIPTILRSMREEGCPPPSFDVDESRVLCILPAHPRYAAIRELRAIEQDLAIGEYVEARRAVVDLLVRDPGNARALGLFAEIHVSLRDPLPVQDWLNRNIGATAGLPRDVLLQFSEALLSGDDTTDEQRSLARRLLVRSATGRLQELEFRRIAIGMIRSREHKGAVQLIDEYARQHPEVEHSASFHQLRGDALIGMANKCRNAARRGGVPVASRERSWSQFDQYIVEAKAHLERASVLDPQGALTNVILRNQTYVDELGDRGQRDRRPRRHQARSREA